MNVENRRTILKIACAIFLLILGIYSYAIKEHTMPNGIQRITSKGDDLPPCGEVCEYDGFKEIIDPAAPYPVIRKHFNCPNILKRMAYNGHNITYPPPKDPPSQLVDAFTQNGEVPFRAQQYIVGFKPENPKIRSYTRQQIDNFIEKSLGNKSINTYNTNGCMLHLLQKYRKTIKNKSALVIGTQIPWLESMLLANGAHRVTTLEYGKLVLNHPLMDYFTPSNYVQSYLNGDKPGFDVAASFSSIEHSGLGRYGDPINPYGDMEAVAQIWCFLKPGGLLFLGLPGVENEDSSYINWNAHRRYSMNRVKHLAANWDYVEMTPGCRDYYRHFVLVLEKPQ